MTIKVGITSKLCPEYLDEIITQGINLSYEEYLLELKFPEDSDEYNEACEMYESNDDTYLIGDWIKKDDGKYHIDKDGPSGFAGTFSSNIACIEWSKLTKKCRQTSPCYVMANGSGLCGDLDSIGTSEEAYTLPDDYFYNEEV